MAVWNLGSINVDLFYDLPHLPGPGETLASTGHRRGLGGKGANMSVAAARAAARSIHIGAVGADGIWARDLLLEYGVDTHFIAHSDEQTGHAVIATDRDGENNIILYQGANASLKSDHIRAALSEAETGDWFVTQNETNLQPEGAALARQMGMKIAYVAAPFSADAVKAVLPFLDVLILNEVEAEQLALSLGVSVADMPVEHRVVTLGEKGSLWYAGGKDTLIEPFRVVPVDTTGAGDTFAGYLIACLDRGQPMEQALRTASLASAIMVTRKGTADVIPDLKDLEDFRGA